MAETTRTQAHSAPTLSHSENTSTYGRFFFVLCGQSTKKTQKWLARGLVRDHPRFKRFPCFERVNFVKEPLAFFKKFIGVTTVYSTVLACAIL